MERPRLTQHRPQSVHMNGTAIASRSAPRGFKVRPAESAYGARSYDPGMTVPAILAEGLLKRYDDLVAVDRCSFAVEEGEVFGFLGPNGAGKTSTMRMIACVSPKTEGRLEVFGMSVDEHPREIKALIGVVSQENNLDTDLTVFENLTVFA